MSNESLTEQQKLRIQASLESRAEQLESAYESLAMEAAGVAQASELLRQALDKVNACLDAHEYETAANLGYRDVSSEYIFLQRTMGSLNSAALECSELISEIAGDCNLSHEQVKPYVIECFNSLRGEPVSKEEMRKRIDEMMARFRRA